MGLVENIEKNQISSNKIKAQIIFSNHILPIQKDPNIKIISNNNNNKNLGLWISLDRKNENHSLNNKTEEKWIWKTGNNKIKETMINIKKKDLWINSAKQKENALLNNLEKILRSMVEKNKIVGLWIDLDKEIEKL